MTTLIDADSLIYAIGWIYKDADDEEFMRRMVRNRIEDILEYSGADRYLLAVTTDKCFRYEYYKMRPYKGNRPTEKPDWFVQWQPVLMDVLTNKYYAVTARKWEADDIICCLADRLRAKGELYTIASTDKDMKQMVGVHMDIRTEEPEIVTIGQAEADYNFWMQVLTGDTSDNICGLEKCGKVGAQKLLGPRPVDVELEDIPDWSAIVEEAFIAKYGVEQGPINYENTVYTVMMIRKGHPYYAEDVATNLERLIKDRVVNL